MATSPKAVGREALCIGFVLLLVQTAAPQVMAAPLPEAASRRHLRYADREVR